MDWDWLGYLLTAVAVVCFLLPPRLDPAICWKTWLEARREIERGRGVPQAAQDRARRSRPLWG